MLLDEGQDNTGGKLTIKISHSFTSRSSYLHSFSLGNEAAESSQPKKKQKHDNEDSSEEDSEDLWDSFTNKAGKGTN